MWERLAIAQPRGRVLGRPWRVCRSPGGQPSHTPSCPRPAAPPPLPQVSSQEALEASQRYAWEKGIFVGISSGATGTAAERVRRACGGAWPCLWR